MSGRWTEMKDRRGISLIEMVASLAVLGVLIAGLAGLVLIGNRQLNYGDADSSTWSAVQHKLEELRAQGHDNLANGNETVNGVELRWEVSGSAPKKIVLIAKPPPGAASARPDTFVTLVSREGP